MRLILTLSVLMASSAWANIITTPGQALIAVDGSPVGKHVCYYQDEGYSLGAILQVGEHYMLCTKANDFETNGALKWSPMTHQVEAENVTKPNTKRYSVK
ncbi:DUF1496 domain-containing protein [Vibrio ostreicida]|uniref:DUF1496 domain-containing protein n=1 Tax=Vibrio ostreicida TaxID=526588 RepID=UPI0009712EDC|nr:DUF1496 domain-containing protein [Vibrio ostreicida]